MDDFEYFRINGHYPYDSQSDISERFEGEALVPDWDDEFPEKSQKVELFKPPICTWCDATRKCQCSYENRPPF